MYKLLYIKLQCQTCFYILLFRSLLNAKFTATTDDKYDEQKKYIYIHLTMQK